MNIKRLSAHISNYTPNGNRKIDYIAIHYTANNGDTAWGNCNYFSKANRGASANYFVDTEEIWQSVDDMDVAWHCGAKVYKHKYCRNANSIGIEMCSRINSKGIYYIEPETVKNTQTLVKELMEKYNIPIENVLRHYDVTGKSCPKPFVENEQLWIDFKKGLEDKELTIDEAKKIIQDNCGFDDNTMKYLDFYKYSESLILRLAEAIEE